MADLKPCPFCGYRPGPLLLAPVSCCEAVVCNHCGAYGPPGDGEAGAVAAWERRDGVAACHCTDDEAILCSRECDRTTDPTRPAHGVVVDRHQSESRHPPMDSGAKK